MENRENNSNEIEIRFCEKKEREKLGLILPMNK